MVCASPFSVFGHIIQRTYPVNNNAHTCVNSKSTMATGAMASHINHRPKRTGGFIRQDWKALSSWPSLPKADPLVSSMADLRDLSISSSSSFVGPWPWLKHDVYIILYINICRPQLVEGQTCVGSFYHFVLFTSDLYMTLKMVSPTAFLMDSVP